MKLRILAVAALAVASVFAQTQTPAHNPGRHMRGARLQQLSQQLNLTPDQQAQAKEIFGSAATTARPIAQQLRDARKQLSQDVKTGAPEDVIAKDSNSIGSLTSQLTVIRAKARGSFYQTLTADQKTKLETLKPQGRRARG